MKKTWAGEKANFKLQFDARRKMNDRLRENFTAIPNAFLEELCRANLSPYQTRLLMLLIRQTFGYHRKSTVISITQMQVRTGLKRRHASRTLRELQAMNIIVTNRGDDTRMNSYEIQRDITKWRLSPRKVTKRIEKLRASVSPVRVTGSSLVEVTASSPVGEPTVTNRGDDLPSELKKELKKKEKKKGKESGEPLDDPLSFLSLDEYKTEEQLTERRQLLEKQSRQLLEAKRT